MRAPLPRRLVAGFAATAAALSVAGAAHAREVDDRTSQPDIAAVRAATAQFKDVTAATAAGYSLLLDGDGVACIDEPDAGGMGIHYVNIDLVLDPTFDPTMPEVLVYELDAHDRLKLVAVEYVAFESDLGGTVPELFGRTFHRMPGAGEAEPQNRYDLPAFYELHLWLWKHNSEGMFSDWNSKVVCP